MATSRRTAAAITAALLFSSIGRRSRGGGLRMLHSASSSFSSRQSTPCIRCASSPRLHCKPRVALPAPYAAPAVALRSFGSTPPSRPPPRISPPLSLLRNVGIIAHIDAGKTTTTERFLFYSNRLRSLGDVDRGDTHTDFLPEERRRGITIKAAATSLPWRGHTLTLIDTPGHVDFTQEVEGSLRVMDGAVLVLDSVKGVQAQTHTVYRQAQRHSTPTIAYVNKMDRHGADIHSATQSITQRLGKAAVLLQLPLYSEAEPSTLRGVVDLVSQEEVTWDGADHGLRYSRQPLHPSHPLHAAAALARERLLEGLAELDDAFLPLFLDATPPTPEDIRGAIRRLTLCSVVIPVLCGSSLRNTGVQLLMDAVVDFLPSPSDVRSVRVRGPKRAKGKQAGRRRALEGTKEEEEERPVDLSESGPLLALAFKVTHDLSRGAVPLVFVRVYSGRLQVKDALINSAASHRRPTPTPPQRPLKLLHVDGEEHTEVQSIECGCIGAVVGLRDTVSGDTLVRAGEEEVWMEGVAAPEPAFFAAVEADNADEEKRLMEALQCIVREDASVSVDVSEETGQTVLRVQGQLHLEVVFHRLIHDFKVKAQLGRMRVAYREGLTGPGEAELYAVNGGAAAVLGIKVEPLPPSSGLVVDVTQAERWTAEEALAVIQSAPTAVPASVPAPPLPVTAFSSSLPLTPALSLALHSTLLSSLQRGPLLGFPLLDVSLTVTRYFLTTTSTPSSLRSTAAQLTRRLLKEMAERGEVAVLEPVMSVVVVADKRNVGDVLTDLRGTRRGVIGEVEGIGGGGGSGGDSGSGGGGDVREEIRASVPLREMVGYADVLRSRTGGTATYSMHLSAYAPLSPDLQRKLIQNPNW